MFIYFVLPISQKGVVFFLRSFSHLTMVGIPPNFLHCVWQSFLFARQLHANQADILQLNELRRTSVHRPATVSRSRCYDGNDDRGRLIDDNGVEELLPAFELSSHRRSSATATGETADVLMTPPSATMAFSFVQMFGGSFEEPTNEELVRHLQRHTELGVLISS